MQFLELLAPARNKDIGIAAIDCGADAVYIAGPDFGARKAAGNGFEDINELCNYAHKFGARIFVTYNILIHDDELEALHAQMLSAQEAGADAFIIRDERITDWKDITVPLHASTQCAIRDVDHARHFEALGCSRIILERELPLKTIKEICSAVSCEVEFFVHGALCVCYSGECRLSEKIDGRSADRGECIQACRSLYDLEDGEGNILLHNKAILSLKDYNLRDRLEDLAEAGVTSFKIEGRLKNVSYVRNVVRDYDLALNALVAKYPDKYRRASFGRIVGGFQPDTTKTFNRGYTELFLDGKRGKWSSMDAPKSMGEEIGVVEKVRRADQRSMEVRVRLRNRGIVLRNGDGFSFTARDGQVTGFRGDICDGNRIISKEVSGLKEGSVLFRNINQAFEKILDTQLCHREIPVSIRLSISGNYKIEAHVFSEDGREILSTFNTDVETAENRERAEAMLREQLSKRSGIYAFRLNSLDVSTKGSNLPLLSASTINSIRRLLAEDLDAQPCCATPLSKGNKSESADGFSYTIDDRLLMKTKYCVRYELGLCPVHQGAKAPEKLFIVNNGRRFALEFDCKACEMHVTSVQK